MSQSINQSYKLLLARIYGCLSWNRTIILIILPPNWKISDGIGKFIALWPIDQWVSSIIALFFIYMFFFVILNKIPFTKKYFIAFKPGIAVFLFILDIVINIILDILVLSFPGFFPIILVKMVTSCPISISPCILGPELLFFKWYYAKKKKV